MPWLLRDERAVRLAKEITKSQTEEAQSDLFAELIRREAEALLTSVQTFDEPLADTDIRPQPVAEAEQADRQEIDQWLGIDSRRWPGLRRGPDGVATDERSA